MQKRPANPHGLLVFLQWNHAWNKFHLPPKLIPKAINQVAELGPLMIRTDILWSDIDTGPQRYDFSKYDHILGLLEEKKIPTLAILHYNKKTENGKDVVWNAPPSSFDEFSDYVFTTVNRYKHFISHWEIWNEPNLSEYWVKPMDDLKTYSELLKISYQAAKKADPKCTVLNGGLTEPIVKDVQNLYQHAGKDYFDILNLHTFINPAAADAENQFNEIITSVQKIMNQYEDGDKKIWITEMGCPGVPEGEPQGKWFAGESINENEQADWLEKQFRMIENHPQIEKLFWAFYRDCKGVFNQGTDFFGLVRPDFSEKPSFKRLKKLIQEYTSNVSARS